ncbi:Uncharacterised protein [uncultured archaeon]|nr:Uncharacterised protein [uncultured archaeon]
MRISKTFIKIFLTLFLVILISNITTLIFGGWNFYLGGVLLLFIIASVWMFLRKTNPEAAKYTLLITGGILVAILLVFAVFFTLSFFSSSTKTYSYDIGGKIDTNNSYIYPLDRLSNSSVQNTTNITYRNITSYLVYFTVPAEYSTGKVNVSFSVFENLPYGSMISIRGKNSTNWSYIDKLGYVSLGTRNVSVWKTVSVSFNASELFVENNVYAFAIESSQLMDAKTKLNYVSLDWINVSESKN